MVKTGLPPHPACPGWGSLCLQHPGSALLGAQAGRPRSVAAGRTSAFLHRDDPFLPAPGRGGLRRGSRVPPASPHPPHPFPVVTPVTSRRPLASWSSGLGCCSWLLS